jgi:cytochrome c553
LRRADAVRGTFLNGARQKGAPGQMPVETPRHAVASARTWCYRRTVRWRVDVVRRCGARAARVVLVLALVAGCAGPARLWRGDVELGRRVYSDKGCYGCHTMGVAGTPIAPDLAHIGRKYDRDRLVDWLRDPTAFCPAHMPRVAMSERELQALADYLASLR